MRVTTSSFADADPRHAGRRPGRTIPTGILGRFLRLDRDQSPGSEIGRGRPRDSGRRQSLIQRNTRIVASMDAAVRTHVYLVEDSPSIRTRLREMLTRTGHIEVVGEADNPQAAIAGILASRPDTVILDLHLIGGSGVQVLRTVHPEAPAIKFIVLTNHPNDQYHRICMEAGASHFLDKSNEFMKISELVSGRPANLSSGNPA